MATASALAALDPDDQRAREARTVDRGDNVDVGEADARFDERLRDDVVDDLDVRAARDLGNDAAEPGVQVRLARHDRRPHDATVLHHGRRGLVTRRLDPEDAGHQDFGRS